jgi:hypothetical protein
MIGASDRARSWAIELAVCCVTGALLGVVGPFGSFLNDVLLVRIAYWVIVFLSCSLTLGAAIRTLHPRARAAGVPTWAWTPAIVLAIAVPLMAFTRLVASAFWPRIGSAVSVVDWYGQTVVVCLVYLALYAALALVLRKTRAAGVPVASDGSPRILRHLPGKLGDELLCLSMEDHYVRLHTAHGSVLVLMSLNQALAEIGDLDGVQVHRSWWVARMAVDEVVEDGRNLRLRLISGIEAPVSRASVARLRSAGWL